MCRVAIASPLVDEDWHDRELVVGLKQHLLSNQEPLGTADKRSWVIHRGAEIARSEEIKRGSITLQTFRADIDFKRERAVLPYGTIGVKVWIYRGKIFADKKKEVKN